MYYMLLMQRLVIVSDFTILLHENTVVILVGSFANKMKDSLNSRLCNRTAN